jgi:LmbE family N-acetylglucosaminyl deacetylase
VGGNGRSGAAGRVKVVSRAAWRAMAAAALLMAAGPAPAAGCCAAQLAVAAPPGEGPAAARLPPFDAQTSLLVVAPHPDDETLCCAGVMQRVARAGGRVSVVWITSGDASELSLLLIEKSPFMTATAARQLAVRRMREARAAAALLGVPAAGQLFLGYPDRGLEALIGAHRHVPYRSRFTAARAVPYADAVFPGHPYTGQSLEEDFAAILARVRPTLVLAPSPRDRHPDHSAAGMLTLQALGRLGELSAARLWIVHGGEGWPSPRGLYPGLPLTPPPCSLGGPASAFALEPAEEDAQLAAVRAYATQIETLGPFLLAFVRTTELFRAAPEGVRLTAARAAASLRASDRVPPRFSRAADRATPAAASTGD